MQGGAPIHRRGYSQMGWAIGKDERHTFSLYDVELCDGREILAMQRERCAEDDPTRTSGGSKTGFIFELRHPRDGGAIVKAQRQVQSHRNLAAPPFDQTDDGGIQLADGHEIDQGDTAVCRFEERLQHHRAIAVAAAHAGGRINGSDPPSPVLGCSEQGRKAGRAVEPWPAQPIDGAVATHESGRRAVAD